MSAPALRQITIKFPEGGNMEIHVGYHADKNVGSPSSKKRQRREEQMILKGLELARWGLIAGEVQRIGVSEGRLGVTGQFEVSDQQSGERG